MEQNLQERLIEIANMLRYFNKFEHSNMLINISVALQIKNIKYDDDLRTIVEEHQDTK